ncbi:hypothetical protein OG935_12860 [Nocardia cyriacigeorgica]|uniref:hypothetical protein n=1 Tax=Nocardia cyriacigeorgica TaxID=135487 RepID=UPI00031E371A|nr:hypothetical protein [Nocardia cyriacigeorgica]MBF6323523.1 hypothetical protein [Nocardia cyriacigeorgica]
MPQASDTWGYRNLADYLCTHTCIDLTMLQPASGKGIPDVSGDEHSKFSVQDLPGGIP